MRKHANKKFMTNLNKPYNIKKLKTISKFIIRDIGLFKHPFILTNINCYTY